MFDRENPMPLANIGSRDMEPTQRLWRCGGAANHQACTGSRALAKVHEVLQIAEIYGAL